MRSADAIPSLQGDAPFYTFHYHTEDCDRFLLTSQLLKGNLHYCLPNYPAASQIKVKHICLFVPNKPVNLPSCDTIGLTALSYAFNTIHVREECGICLCQTCVREAQRLTAQPYCFFISQCNTLSVLLFTGNAVCCSLNRLDQCFVVFSGKLKFYL